MNDVTTVVSGFELVDLKKHFLFASKVSFGTRNGLPILIITPEDGKNIDTIVWANTPQKKDIA